MKVKICGLMRPEDLRLCALLGADVAGFVVDYPLPVPWNLSPAQARPLLSLVDGPMKSCLVTGGSREKILAMCKSLRPDFVQLHYKESLQDTAFLAAALRPLGIGVIQSLPLSPAARLAQLGSRDIFACAEALEKTEVFALLLDGRGPENAAAGGRTPDLALFSALKHAQKKPLILAGGINPENVRALAAQSGAEFLDVLSGVESRPGQKDAQKLRALFEALHTAG